MVNPHGIWNLEEAKSGHDISCGLADWLVRYLEKDEVVLDVGCGDGGYSKVLIKNGFNVKSYEGTPDISQISGIPIQQIDLAVPTDIGIKGQVICLEVGEHIPPEYEDIFCDNICKMVGSKLILSWALPWQGGCGHVNCHELDYVLQKFSDRGFQLNEDATIDVRKQNHGKCGHFEHNIMVFDRVARDLCNITPSCGNSKDDLIVGSIYNVPQWRTQVWVESLKEVGFKGHKMMICYGPMDSDTEKYLRDNEFDIRFPLNENSNRVVWDKMPNGWEADGGKRVVVERFLDYWRYLKDTKHRYVIATDVVDVLFQSNPSDWLEQNLGNKRLNIGSESIHYKNEWFGRDHIKASMPWIGDWMQDKIIYNAGTISGHCKDIADLGLSVYSICAYNPNFNPDQDAFNALMQSEPWKSITKFSEMEDGWALQCGLINEGHRPYLQGPYPHWDGKFAFVRKHGKKYCIVHQYPRLAWNATINQRYGIK